MDEYLKQIDRAIETNTAIKQRTPWLETSLGHLRTAKEHFQEHLKASAKTAATAPVPAPTATK